jgi:hypothetical protein
MRCACTRRRRRAHRPPRTMMLLAATMVMGAHTAGAGAAATTKKPNLVLILTDDQDIVIGGMRPMPHTVELLGKQGATLDHWYVNTPVCCPSRSEYLSGRYHHNIRQDRYETKPGQVTCSGDEAVGETHHCGCMHMNCSDPFESQTYANYLKKAGYSTAYFGKYLNPPAMEDYCSGVHCSGVGPCPPPPPPPPPPEQPPSSPALPLARESAPATPPPLVCTQQKRLHDKGLSTETGWHESSNTSSADDCCAKCSATGKCVAWSWHPPSNPSEANMCSLWASVSKGHHSAGTISGVNGRPSMPTPPPPPPGPPPRPRKRFSAHGWDTMRGMCNTAYLLLLTVFRLESWLD